MAVGTEVVAVRYEDIVADTPISVPYPAYEALDILVYYGSASLQAVFNTDYTIDLAGDFDTFTLTPTASLLTKINALIAADPTNEENYITVRRRLGYLTDSTAAAVRYTPFTSREFERTVLRFQQIQEQLNRCVSLTPNFVGDEPRIQIAELVANRVLVADATGTNVVAGPTAQEVDSAAQYAEDALSAKDAAVAAMNTAIDTLDGKLDTDAGNIGDDTAKAAFRAAIGAQADLTVNGVSDAHVASDAAIAYSKLQPGIISMVRVRVVDAAGGDPATDYASGLTVDGVTLAEGDTVLRATTGGSVSDGPYVVGAGAASRLSLFPNFNTLPGVQFSVEEGIAYADTTWRCTSNRSASAVIGVDTLAFSRIVNDISSVYALPASPYADLREFMDARFGSGSWTYRTGVGVGSDAGLAMEDALDALRMRYGRGVLQIPPTGIFLVTTPPSAAKLSGNKIEGFGSQASRVCMNNSSTALFHFSGAGGFTGGGVSRLSIFLEDGFGTTGLSTAILLQGDATSQPDQTSFDDLYITSLGAGSYWYNGFNVFGSARTSPQGVRVGTINNLQVFNCRNVGAGFYNAVQWTVSNIGVYSGLGTGGNVYIGGGGSFNTNTTQFSMENLIGQDLNLTNATRVKIHGACRQIQAASSFNLYDLFLDTSLPLSGILGANGRSVFL